MKEVKEKVIAALTEHGECTPENVERAMSSKIYDLDELIDIQEYVRKMEEEQRKKAEQKRGAVDDWNSSCGCVDGNFLTDKSSRNGRQKIRGNTEAYRRERGGWCLWELT